MKINGIEGLTSDQIRVEVSKGGKFVTFSYCISIVVMSFRRTSDVFFVRAGEKASSFGMKYTLLSLFLGWWGIPFGIFWTIQALLTNLGGGNNVTNQIMTLHFSQGKPPIPAIQTPALAVQGAQQLINQAVMPLESQGPTRTCPRCAETIQLEARICKHCGLEFNEADIQLARQQAEEKVLADQRVAKEKADQQVKEKSEKRRRNKNLAFTIRVCPKIT